jgi:alkylhydroperoxidase family enzyme
MGHSEMLLAVAGLKQDEVAARVRRLAAGDWSGFPPAERAALELSYKLSRDPAGFTAADRAALTRVFGGHRAADLVWYVSWCNYMTRVADAFQLPLERDNVFTPAPKR